MKLKQEEVRWKNRIQSTLDKCGFRSSYTDSFGDKGLKELGEFSRYLPEQTRGSVINQLEHWEQIRDRIERLEDDLETMLEESDRRNWLRTIPGGGRIPSSVLLLEIGTIDRFDGPVNLASYAGTTPRVHQSGGQKQYGSLRKDANQMLKWAFFEAANTVIRLQEHYSDSRLVKKYRRLKDRKNTGVAKGAAARILAESTYWVLTKKEPYKEP